MFASWILFPLLLLALCLGCGLLLEAAAGRRLPGPLLAPAGFAAIVVVASVLTARGETAPLATPGIVLLALLGTVLAFPSWRRRRPDGWLLAAALGVFAVYAAPVVLSGNPTFTGYIKLDDTATWMAFVDRAMEHGRDLSGLSPSTYQTTLQVNLPGGYPLGAFLPLGAGARLTGTDVAWLVQPYMATMAALLGAALYWLARELVPSRPWRAAVAFGAAQSALLFGYALWGGIKELAVALGIAVLAALAPGLLGRAGWRATVPAALATAALLSMVGPGGIVWAAPILGLVAVALWRARGGRALWRSAWPLALTVAVLTAPALFAAEVFSPTQGGLTSAAELGNLLRPLHASQFAGIWISGDFRVDPGRMELTTYLIALALAAAAAGAWLAWRARAWRLLLYAATATAGSLAAFAYSSPWVGAKALASGSPALLLLALAGAAAFAARVERMLGATVLALLLAGVLWSNALGYHDVSLAPYEQLRELESIGEEFAGEGPTLMTEYQPYGVRHFLRKADAEGAAELRYRPIRLRGGGELAKGEWADTDQLALSTLLTYRTLVLRRSPAQSRPPSPYRRVRHGEYYDVWQRPPRSGRAFVEHVPFGNFEDPAATPSCAAVLGAAAAAGPEGTVAAVERQPTVVVSVPALEQGGTASLEVTVPRSGRYEVYLQGGTRNRLTARVDGVEVGAAENQRNEQSQFLHLGDATLAAGTHRVTLALDGQDLGPGSGAPPLPIGPLVLSAASNDDPRLRELPAGEAAALCGRHLDWVEALR